MNDQTNIDNHSFACDMSGLSTPEREKHIATIQKVFGAVKKVRELPDGYEFRLDTEEHLLLETAEFIAKEQLCCPFFRFELKTKSGEPIRLRLKGADGIKPFIKTEIGGALAESVSREAGFTD